MIARLPALLVALAAPTVAFGGNWFGQPELVWLGSELAWAQPHHPANLSLDEVEDLFDAPPRAGWCGPLGLDRQPTALECTTYDEDLTSWLMDFVDTNVPADVAHIPDPPTYCGGC